MLVSFWFTGENLFFTVYVVIFLLLFHYVFIYDVAITLLLCTLLRIEGFVGMRETNILNILKRFLSVALSLLSKLSSDLTFFLHL